jgi:hypothetical protein
MTRVEEIGTAFGEPDASVVRFETQIATLKDGSL